MKLGRYEVVRELGKGAMGIVFLAKDPLIGRLVALKTIRPAAHADDEETREFQQRFIREAQAAGILNHPSIVTVHDIGQDEASAVSFIAMEYVEGQNLKEILAQGRTLTFEQIGDLIGQIADALDFAHSKGIVHRDVKPANIILVEGNRAKITDFGIAKIASGGANLTTTGQFLGTPNYMAPEQIKGTPVDGRTDIFSLGICLYECLTRRKPFGGDSLTSISYKIVHEPFPPLAEMNPQIPEGFEEVVAQCLAKDPAKRYQRGKELAAALRAVGRGERPSRPEPLLADETVVTRDGHERVPTVEIPFPQAEEVASMATNPSIRPTPATVPALTPTPPPQPAATPAPQQPPRAATAPRKAVGSQVRNTLSNVRSAPLWRQRIHPIVFVGIVVLLVASLLGAVVSIRKKQPDIPKVDKQAEARRAQERQLRQEANKLLQQGRVTDAHEKFEQLQKLAPKSPYVAGVVEKLNAIRQQEEVGKQQLAIAQQKLDQGIALYNEKKYAEAIPLLEDSFHINPNSEEAATYLKNAQIEQQKIDETKAKAKQQRLAQQHAVVPPQPAVQPGGTSGDGAQQPINNTPAKLSTILNSPVGDGYVQVKVGATVVVHENLWEERGRGIFRRKVAHVVNVAREVAPADTDVDIWVVVPSMNFNDHKVVRHKFQPGSENRLLINFDARAKRVDVSFN